MEIPEKEVREFVRSYVKALKRLIEENRKQVESTGIKPRFPTEFPVKATAFLVKRGIILNFDRADRFTVSVKRGERPHRRSRWGEFILHRRFAVIKDKAREKAESDVKYLLSLPKIIEDYERQHEQEMREYHDALWVEEMDFEIQHYVRFLNEAKNVVDKTKEAAPDDFYDLITVIRNHLSNYEYMLRVGCKALDRLYFMINSDLETSFFLALHGKYFSAMAILRKVLEVNCRCVYLDSTFEGIAAERRIDDWTTGARFPERFRDVVTGVINEHIDRNLTDLLKKLGTFENGSFKQSILSLYKELHVFVHLRPSVRWDEDLKLSFSEFNLDKWRRYYLTFMKIVKFAEILLVLKFPRISSLPSISNPAESYNSLQLSKQELDAVAGFSA